MGEGQQGARKDEAISSHKNEADVAGKAKYLRGDVTKGKSQSRQVCVERACAALTAVLRENVLCRLPSPRRKINPRPDETWRRGKKDVPDGPAGSGGAWPEAPRGRHCGGWLGPVTPKCHQLPRCRGTCAPQRWAGAARGNLCAPLAPLPVPGYFRPTTASSSPPLLPHPCCSYCNLSAPPHRPLRSLPLPPLNQSITLKCEEPPIPV
uniref:Uncharacterized protein n=1 Tax=Myotis myotis TaxID=51298 RepID=A0A7J7WHR5_MYOMY|nr:hypothetical protein mMyoMyo1_012157 [Myotis myotis]